MARLTENDGREFTVTRTPDVESAGYPCLFAVTLDGHCLCSMVLRPVERLVFSPKER